MYFILEAINYYYYYPFPSICEFLLLEHPDNPCHHHFHFRYHDEDGGGDVHCEGDIIYIEAKY